MENIVDINNKVLKKKRIEWIDLAKGITILLVIIGHTIKGPARAVIFSFHMPLFFILSCVTFKCSKNNNEFIKKTEKAFHHLVIPALIVYLIVLTIDFIKNINIISDFPTFKLFLSKQILKLVFASGTPVSLNGFEIEALGSPWFFIALFVGRSLYDYLNLKVDKKYFIIVITILSIIGFVISYIVWLPFSFDIVLCMLPLFYIGTNLEDWFKLNEKKIFKLFVYLCVWIIFFAIAFLISHSYLDMARRRYVLYPLCYLIAVAGTLTVSEFSVLVANVKIFKPLLFIGKNSLYLLCIHKLDVNWKILWNLTENYYINSLVRVICDLIVFVIFLTIKYFVSKILKKKVKYE